LAIPDPSILPELAKTKFPRLFPLSISTLTAELAPGTRLSGPEVLFLQALDELERREEGRGDTHCLSGAQIRSLTAWQAGAELPCIALLCLALPPLPPLPSQPPITKAQSRGGERQSTIAPLRYEPGTAAQTSLRCEEEARRASHSLIGVVRPLNRVSPHTARLVPKFGGSQAKKIVCERGGSTRRGHCSDSCERAVILSLSLGYCVEVR
jgi:hypothetical protein